MNLPLILPNPEIISRYNHIKGGLFGALEAMWWKSNPHKNHCWNKEQHMGLKCNRESSKRFKNSHRGQNSNTFARSKLTSNKYSTQKPNRRVWVAYYTLHQCKWGEPKTQMSNLRKPRNRSVMFCWETVTKSQFIRGKSWKWAKNSNNPVPEKGRKYIRSCKQRI